MLIMQAGSADYRDGTPVLFLAGPNTRHETPSREYTKWRNEAIQILNDLNFHCTVCIPEPYVGDHDTQVTWEQEWLKNADTIVFWVDRRYYIQQYATTTNLEFGQYIGCGEPKVMYGRPDDANSIRSNDWHAKKNGVRIFTDLRELLTAVVSLYQ